MTEPGSGPTDPEWGPGRLQGEEWPAATGRGDSVGRRARTVNSQLCDSHRGRSPAACPKETPHSWHGLHDPPLLLLGHQSAPYQCRWPGSLVPSSHGARESSPKAHILLTILGNSTCGQDPPSHQPDASVMPLILVQSPGHTASLSAGGSPSAQGAADVSMNHGQLSSEAPGGHTRAAVPLQRLILSSKINPRT